jgi:HD-GYP domain-containing protein (c-di-GMP phosphodiesterase class II)
VAPREAPPSPRSATGFLVALGIAAALCLALALWRWGLPDPLSAFVAMLALSALAQAAPATSVRHVSILLHSVVLLAAVPLASPAGAMLAHALPSLWRYRRLPSRAVFNAATPVVAVLLGSLLAEALTGERPTGGAAPGELAIDLAVLTLVAGIINAALLASVLLLTEATPVSTTLRGLAPQMVPAYLGYGLGAYLLVLMWDTVGLGVVAVLLLLPSLLVAQWGLLQHAREHELSEVMLRGLVEALDIRSPGARADSELGARVATAVAQHLHLRVRDVEAVTAAARLHDIGMLALDGDRLDTVLAGDGHEHQALMRHPVVGADLLREVQPLRAALPAVLAHHELWDGSGYPSGSAGTDIPLGARVVTLADAWVSLVQPRRGTPVSPPEALRRCEELAGTALDPRCVVALREVYERHPEILDPTAGPADTPFADAVAGAEDDRAGEPEGWTPQDQSDPVMTHWVARQAELG